MRFSPAFLVLGSFVHLSVSKPIATARDALGIYLISSQNQSITLDFLSDAISITPSNKTDQFQKWTFSFDDTSTSGTFQNVGNPQWFVGFDGSAQPGAQIKGEPVGTNTAWSFTDNQNHTGYFLSVPGKPNLQITIGSQELSLSDGDGTEWTLDPVENSQ